MTQTQSRTWMAIVSKQMKADREAFHPCEVLRAATYMKIERRREGVTELGGGEVGVVSVWDDVIH